MSSVLTLRSEEPPPKSYPPDFAAVLLTHAAGSTLDARSEDSGESLAGLPAFLVLEVVRTAALGQTIDLYAAIDRVVRLWRHFGDRVTRGGLGRSPLELLREASELELEEILGAGFALLTRRITGLNGGSIFDPPDLGILMEAEKKEAFLKLVARDAEAFAAALSEQESRFGFLPFERTPVLITERGLLVLDEDYLWARVSTGLYWIVHDYLKFEKAPGTDTNLRWNDAYGEMVELFAEDSLRAMAPRLLGESEAGSTFYTEEDFQAAYEEGKKCDAATYYGGTLLMTEVVSGRLSVPTRIEGSVEQFKKDTDRLVIDKCRQLHEAATAVLADEHALTGFAPTPHLRVVPVIVVAGGYPVTPPTMSYVRETLGGTRLLDDARVEALSIIDLEELEMLEGLAEHGATPVGVLETWHHSSTPHVPLKNFLIRSGMWDVSKRPSRMVASVDATFERVIDALRIPRDEEASQPAEPEPPNA
jgi:hypothetical protein